MLLFIIVSWWILCFLSCKLSPLSRLAEWSNRRNFIGWYLLLSVYSWFRTTTTICFEKNGLLTFCAWVLFTFLWLFWRHLPLLEILYLVLRIRYLTTQTILVAYRDDICKTSFYQTMTMTLNFKSLEMRKWWVQRGCLDFSQMNSVHQVWLRRQQWTT